VLSALGLYSYLLEGVLGNVFFFSLPWNFNFLSNETKTFYFNKIKTGFIFCSFLIVLIYCFLILNNHFYGIGEQGFSNYNIFLVKLLVLIFSTLILIFFESNSGVLTKIYYSYNFVILYFFILISSVLLIAVNDFLSLFVILEFQSLCLYSLASLDKRSATSTEAGLKYFILGSIFTGIFLLAVSTLYGCAGTLNFVDLKLIFFFNYKDDFLYLNYLIFIALFCIFCVFLFKVSAFPFHWWSPDVYEGAPLTSTFVFIFIPKIAFITFLMKFLFLIKNQFEIFNALCVLIGCLTVAIGSFFTLKQNRFKRFLVFSSIAQVGFLISALASCFLDSYGFLYFFFFIYLISSLGTWGVYKIFSISFFFMQSFEKGGLISLSLLTFKRIFEQNFWLSSVIFIVFFSIAGIPPFVGFLSKLFILIELLKNFFTFTVILLTIISSISVYYYIKIVKISFFETTKNYNTVAGFVLANIVDNYDNLLIGLSIFVISFFFWEVEIFLLFSKNLSFSLL
jgi:NADH-quinone oxidoreductase subunit N